jgi:hypothetical protein
MTDTAKLVPTDAERRLITLMRKDARMWRARIRTIEGHEGDSEIVTVGEFKKGRSHREENFFTSGFK